METISVKVELIYQTNIIQNYILIGRYVEARGL